MKPGIRMIVLPACILMVAMAAAASNAQDRNRPSFADLDTNADGKVSLDEFSKVGGRRGTPENTFKRMDANGDGYITEDEYQTRRRGGRND